MAVHRTHSKSQRPQGQTPSISRDGAISIAGTEVGRIGVVAFERPELMKKAGNNLLSAAEGVAQTTFTGVVQQGALESSNVRPVIELTRLIEISRAYQSAAKIVSGADELRQRTIERLGRAA